MSAESAISRIPDNGNLLQATKYTFIIPELPFARYFCQSVILPSVSTSEIMMPTPFSDTYRHGDKLVYEPITLTVIVDEDLKVWEETHNWLKALTSPTNFEEYRRIKSRIIPAYYDGILTINTNANIPNLRLKFRNCHPISLGSIQFSSSDSADTTILTDITFRYDYYDIERI